LAGKNGKFVYEKIFGYQDVRKNIYCNTKPYSSLSGGSIIKNSFPSFSLLAFASFYSFLFHCYTKALTGPFQGLTLKRSSLRQDGISSVQGSD